MNKVEYVAGVISRKDLLDIEARQINREGGWEVGQLTDEELKAAITDARGNELTYTEVEVLDSDEMPELVDAATIAWLREHIA